jgi:hypothetical protein
VLAEAPAPEAEPAEAHPPSPPERELRDLAATLRDAATSPDPLARLRELATPADDPFSAAAERLRGAAPAPVEDAADFHAARIAPWSAAIERRTARHRHDGLPVRGPVHRGRRPRPARRRRGRRRDRRARRRRGRGVRDPAPADVLVRERPGRYWLTAPDTDGPEARTLAHRVAGAVTDAPAHRDVPLQAAIGLSVCPADGSDAATLEGRAEEGVYAARAAGVRVAGSPG